MFKKQSLLVSRPRPPSFAEVIEDVSGASEDDVVFSFSENLAEAAAASTPVEDQSLATSVAEQDGTSGHNINAETLYHQACEFMHLMEDLKSAPEKLQVLYDHVKTENQSLQESISNLRQKAEDIKNIGTDFKKIEEDITRR